VVASDELAHLPNLDLNRWVPEDDGLWHSEAEELAERLREGRVCVLTGAGLSTESGIPDYRGGGTARRAQNPMRLAEFLSSSAMQKRYWARSLIGYGRMSQALPTLGHNALRRLELAGITSGLITQNVDGLHGKAGSTPIELHGALAEVICLSCGRRDERARIQKEMVQQNPHLSLTNVPLKPDGDADFPDELLETFRVPTCANCQGPLKPDVVFFGEGVPKPRVERALALLEASQALLVVGSSLAVLSGYRFVRRARELGRAVYLVNIGPTRADPEAQLKVKGRASHVMHFVAERLLLSSS